MGKSSRGFCPPEGVVDEKHLGEAGIKDYLPETKPEDSKHLRNGRCGETQVNGSQHGQEVEHRLVQAALSLDHKHNSEVPYDCNQVHSKKGKTNPDMECFQSWNAQQQEGGGMELGIIGKGHPAQ